MICTLIIIIMTGLQYYNLGVSLVNPKNEVVYVQSDRWESDGLKKKKYSVEFQLKMDLFLQN